MQRTTDAVRAQGTAGADSADFSGRTKAHFSLQHLLAAAAFSREAAELEQRHAGEPLGPFFDDILARCTAAVLSATACVEAYANELLLDPVGTFPRTDSLLHGVYFDSGRPVTASTGSPRAAPPLTGARR